MKGKKIGIHYLCAPLVMALSGVSAAVSAAPQVTREGSLVETVEKVNTIFSTAQTALATGLQLVGIACMGFAAWNVYVSGKPGREDRGHMKTAVLAGLGGVIAYFAPNWIGLGAASLF
ncbi:hypothetical protein [Chromobacterium phragmitis]|uniref:Conjugal transfer protein TrbC n=1 Tax=Chromobacterium phragmitis TaxID=2202141 RepID=A0ABV0J0D8_9NEIS